MPEQEVLDTWTSAELLDYGVESWLWGERCHAANMLNQLYFKCTLQKDEAACNGYTALLTRIRERKAEENGDR